MLNCIQVRSSVNKILFILWKRQRTLSNLCKNHYIVTKITPSIRKPGKEYCQAAQVVCLWVGKKKGKVRIMKIYKAYNHNLPESVNRKIVCLYPKWGSCCSWYLWRLYTDYLQYWLWQLQDGLYQNCIYRKYRECFLW